MFGWVRKLEGLVPGPEAKWYVGGQADAKAVVSAVSDPVGQCRPPEHRRGSRMLVRRQGLLGLVAIVAVLHVAILSFVLGPRCIAYIAAAYLTGVVVWGGVSLSAGKRRVAVVVGAGLTVAVQQMAYQAWKAELAGSWWPVAQFFALQLLIGVGVHRAIRYALGLGASNERHAEEKGRR